MTAKDMLLQDAMKTAIKSEKRRLRTKRILMVSAGLNVITGILLILLLKKRH